MPVWITLIIVIAGISGIVALVHFTGGSVRARLESKAGALKTWLAQFPDHPATGALLEPTGHAALIDLEDGRTGILWAMGRGAAGRVLQGGALQVRGARLRIDLADFTAPHIDVVIKDEPVRRIWAEALEAALTKGDENELS
ncbi:MAG: hypothetical protein L3J37_09875 [Rhodobacteraceae bacterium]|nr:hypothetical protein [Paracoccaceae bacterium]